MVAVDLFGVEEARAKFDAMGRSIARKIVRKATRHGAKIQLAAIRSLAMSISRSNTRRSRVAAERAPADGVARPRMRKVARLLKVRAIRRSRKVTGHSVQTPRRDALGIPQKHPWYFPAHVELGTKRQPARSYLRAGAKASVAAASEEMRRVLAAGIEDEARKRVPDERPAAEDV